MKVIVGLVTLGLAGCAQIKAPTDAEAAAADYGPTPSDFEQTIRQYNAARLKDPGSAQYAGWTQPITYWFGTRDSSTYGYLVCVAINAKNSFGGYTGFQTDGYLLRGRTVVRYFERGRYGASGKVCP